MNQRRRLISFLLLVCILLSTLYLPSGASVAFVSSQEDSSASSVVSENSQLLTPEISAGIPVDLENDAILQYVNQDAFREANHTMRLPSEETLDTYVYLNEDGSKTVYFMDENVKYVDDEGNIQNKDVSLVETKNGYTVAQNDISVFIPTNAANGIQISHEIGNLKLIPQNSLIVVAGQQDGNSVIYPHYFGKGMSLRYTPLLFGVKEDIILASYSGVYSFQFALMTNGLFVYEDAAKGYYVAASQDAQDRYYLGEIVVYDAVGRPSMGNMTVNTVTAGQRYILTVSADPAFLTDADTVYPVTIDPSITVGGANDTNNQIWDVPIFSGKPNSACGAYQYLTLGNADTYGTGRVVVKLPGLYNSSVYNSISHGQINSVYFYCSDGSGNSTQYVNLYPNTGSTTWTESDTTWNSIGVSTYDTTYNWGANVPYGSWTAFDITGLVRFWKTGTYNKEAGFRLIHSDEATRAKHKAIHGSEYATASYRPYVVLNYVSESYPYHISLSNNNINIGANGASQLTAIIEPADASNTTITWTSSNDHVAVTSTGCVHGRSHGSATVTAATANGLSASCVVNVLPDVNGLRTTCSYYIMNVYSSKYMDVYYATNADNVAVTGHPYHGASNQRWRIDLCDESSYFIRAGCSSNLRFLSVSSSENIIIHSENGNISQIFEIERQEDLLWGRSGVYYIKCEGKYLTYSTSDDTLFLSEFPITHNGASLWSFEEVTKISADLYNFSEFDYSISNTTFTEKMETMQYIPSYFLNCTRNQAIARLKGSSIWLHNGHGNRGCIFFGDEIISAQDIDSMNINELAGLRCFITLGCKAGDSDVNGNNLIDSVYAKGAQFALGFVETQYSLWSDWWLYRFIDYSCQGYNIRDSLEYADLFLADMPGVGTGDKYYMGDDYQHLSR